MFPPLPPTPFAPRQHSYAQAAMRGLPPPPPQNWLPHHQTYQNAFPTAPYARRQPLAPRTTNTNVKPRASGVLPRGPTKQYAAGPAPRPPKENNKENQTSVDDPPPRVQKARKPVQIKILKVDKKKTTKKEDVWAIWPIQASQGELGTAEHKGKASIWTVTPLDMTTMLLSARQDKRKPRLLKHLKPLSTKKPSPSNQVTHEWVDYKSESSSAEGSDTDTEDEAPPAFKKCYGLLYLDEFRSDGHDSESHASTSTITRVEDELPTNLAKCGPSAALDYGRLFSSTPSNTWLYEAYPPDFPVTETTSMNGDQVTPPHMLWWPGDWKCSTCGNHNFSYRELCKRCREGRFHEAGFVFPLPQ